LDLSLIINESDRHPLDALRTAIGELRAEGHRVDARLTFEPGDAERFAREAVEAGRDRVIACGGDGTINCVVNGMFAALPFTGEERDLPALGIVPLGTANDLAGYLGLPTDPAEAVRVAVRGQAWPADVGRVNERYFLNVSTAGFGAEATTETAEEAKRMLGSLAYVVTGVQKFVALEARHARFGGEDLIYEGGFLLFAVGNARRTGGGNWLTPRAAMDDGLLDVCVVRTMPRVDFMRLLPDLRAGRHVGNPNVIYRQVRDLRVECDEELSINADGEALTSSDLHYTLAARRLRLMVGRPPDGREGPDA
jgi:diacylglycerol kinase (ATP)